MRSIPAGAKYNSIVWVDDKTKIITKLICKCGDFAFRRIKKVGEFADTKYYAEPCKHLKPVVEALEKLGYKLKKLKEMIGSDKLSAKLRKKLMERANNKCECGCESEELLEVHRKTRRSAGGKYNMDNCQVLNSECHKLRHQNEFPSRRSK